MPDLTACPPEQLERLFIDLIIEGWRFSRVFARVVNKLDAGEAERYVSQFRFFAKRREQNLEDAGLKLVNIEGGAFRSRYGGIGDKHR
jgi:hypothetical protein